MGKYARKYPSDQRREWLIFVLLCTISLMTTLLAWFVTPNLLAHAL